MTRSTAQSEPFPDSKNNVHHYQLSEVLGVYRL